MLQDFIFIKAYLQHVEYVINNIKFLILNTGANIMTNLDPRYLKIKAFAIYFVIAAHCTYNNNLFQQITDIIGTIGVPLFLFVAGVFFKKIKSIDQINNKTKRIVIPWLIWGV